jgi:hypothetical protein
LVAIIQAVLVEVVPAYPELVDVHGCERFHAGYSSGVFAPAFAVSKVKPGVVQFWEIPMPSAGPITSNRCELAISFTYSPRCNSHITGRQPDYGAARAGCDPEMLSGHQQGVGR